MKITAYELAQRYVGIRELAGQDDHPLIQWWLSLCGLGAHEHDETPWCSAFLNGIAWELRLPRSKSAAARSWLAVGRPISSYREAVPGFDVVVLSRGAAPQPGPEVLHAPGHVGLFAGMDDKTYKVQLLAGNQGNAVSIAPFDPDRILGVRRLLEVSC